TGAGRWSWSTGWWSPRERSIGNGWRGPSVLGGDGDHALRIAPEHAGVLGDGHCHAIVGGGAPDDAFGDRAQLSARPVEDGDRLGPDPLGLDGRWFGGGAGHPDALVDDALGVDDQVEEAPARVDQEAVDAQEPG